MVKSWILEKWLRHCTCCKNNTIQFIPVFHLLKKHEDCIINFRKSSFLVSTAFLSWCLTLANHCIVFLPQLDIAFINSKNCSNFAVPFSSVHQRINLISAVYDCRSHFLCPSSITMVHEKLAKALPKFEQLRCYLVSNEIVHACWERPTSW
jgi:hypothetical protein